MTAPNRQPPSQELLERYAEYMSRDENIVGGSLHIMTDDGNLKDSDVDFCMKHAEEVGDTDGAWIAKEMLKLSESQRDKLIRLRYPGQR
jgi:hypothetical protein